MVDYADDEVVSRGRRRGRRSSSSSESSESSSEWSSEPPDPESTTYPAVCEDVRLSGKVADELKEHSTGSAKKDYVGPGGLGVLSVEITTYDEEVPSTLFDKAGEALGQQPRADGCAGGEPEAPRKGATAHQGALGERVEHLLGVVAVGREGDVVALLGAEGDDAQDAGGVDRRPRALGDGDRDAGVLDRLREQLGGAGVQAIGRSDPDRARHSGHAGFLSVGAFSVCRGLGAGTSGAPEASAASTSASVRLPSRSVKMSGGSSTTRVSRGSASRRMRSRACCR